MKFLKLLFYYVLIVISLVGLQSCKVNEIDIDPPVTDTIDIKQTVGVPVNGIRIAWDYSSISCVSQKGWYARIRRLSDNSLIAVYDDQLGNSGMRRSYDNGKTWNFTGNIFSSFYQNSILVLAVNPEIYQLKNGDIIAVCNNRPVKDDVVPFSISIRRSSDLGQSWSSPITIFEGEPRWNDGCWEPTLLQLPNGDLQLYFTDEGRFQITNEQETRMMLSHDGGKTWDATIYNVSYRQGARDGMPVPVLLDDGIIVSIESNPVWEMLRPNILRTKISNPWPQQISANSPEREDPGIQFGNNVRGAGPYIIRIPTGEVLLSYQTNADRTDMNHETVEVAIGDNKGRNFSKITRPFDLSYEKSATWNSLMQWDSTCVAIVSSMDYSSSVVGVWYQLGYIIPVINIENGTPAIDGNLKEKEWKANFPIFIGSKSVDNLKMRFLFDSNNLYLNIAVSDKILFAGTTNADGVNLYFDPQDTKYTTIGSKQFKINCNLNGVVKLYQGKNTNWISVNNNEVQAFITKNAMNQEYTVEMKIPLSFIKKTDLNSMRFNCEFLNYSNETTGYKEPLVNSNINQPNTWIEINFKK